jgi:hypothetical protein
MIISFPGVRQIAFWSVQDAPRDGLRRALRYVGAPVGPNQTDLYLLVEQGAGNRQTSDCFLDEDNHAGPSPDDQVKR